MIQAPLQPAQLESCFGLFRLSRLLHVAVDLGIAPLLEHGPVSAGRLARRLGAHEPAMQAFLEALAAWGVLACDEDRRFGLTPISRRLLPHEPDGINLRLVGGWVGLQPVFEAWSGLEHTLRTGECGLRGQAGRDFHTCLAEESAWNAAYQDAMSSTSAGFAASARMLDRLDFNQVVDIGGGQGDLLDIVLARHPDAKGVCVDLPHVVAGLAPRLGGRLRFEAADALTQLPAGAELYLTSTVLRCFGDDQALVLLRTARRAMTASRARLVCFEMLLPPDNGDPALALANLTAHVVYGGRDRNPDEFRELLGQAGFACRSIDAVEGALHAITATPVRLGAAG